MQPVPKEVAQMTQPFNFLIIVKKPYYTQDSNPSSINPEYFLDTKKSSPKCLDAGLNCETLCIMREFTKYEMGKPPLVLSLDIFFLQMRCRSGMKPFKAHYVKFPKKNPKIVLNFKTI